MPRRPALISALVAGALVLAGLTAASAPASATSLPLVLEMTTNAGTPVSLPLYGTVPTLQVDWGDGGAFEPVNAAGEVPHTYASGGTHTVSVFGGMLTHFGDAVNGYAGAPFLTSVTSFGLLGLTDLSGAFKGASALTTVPTATSGSPPATAG
ncbi:MAG: hypothetical protein H7233_14785 [Pseudorhodobacter sp.]|nr:hypothetical protein [Frankiaceae bacterium]